MPQARSSAFSPTLGGAAAFFLSARFVSDSVARRECSSRLPQERPSRLDLTPQQADLLDFPRVVYSQARILWRREDSDAASAFLCMYSRLRWRANANGIQTRFFIFLGGLIVWYSMRSHGKHGVHYGYCMCCLVAST